MSSTIQNIASALPSLGKARLLINSADDVVIVAAVRTPFTRVSKQDNITKLTMQARKGGFKDTLQEDLLKAVLVEVVKRGKVDPAAIK
jgi:acetyl-CoA acyltransferase 1